MPDTDRLDGSTPPRIQHTPQGFGAAGPRPAPAPPVAASSTSTDPPSGPVALEADPLSTGAVPANTGAPSGSAAATVSTAGAPSTAPPTPSKIIKALGEQRRHEEQWDRSPNTTGTGAIHVRTFHCKLTDEALVYLDQQINEWLDAHPQYEVKFTSTSVGEFTSKLKEPHFIVQVWV